MNESLQITEYGDMTRHEQIIFHRIMRLGLGHINPQALINQITDSRPAEPDINESYIFGPKEYSGLYSEVIIRLMNKANYRFISRTRKMNNKIIQLEEQIKNMSEELNTQKKGK